MIAAYLVIALASQEPPIAAGKLELQVRALDFAGNRKENLMYSPSQAALVTERPKAVHRVPATTGKALYGSVSVGDGPNAVTWFLVQDTDDGSRFWIDLNRNGDLTDDGNGEWDEAQESDGVRSYQATRELRASYGDPSREVSSGPYALNFYRRHGSESLNYYRASRRSGVLIVGDRQIEVALWENGNDGVFNRPFVIQDEATGEQRPTRAVLLSLEGRLVDIRGTFAWNGVNYLAEVSRDGSEIRIAPTFKVVAAPPAPPREAPTLLAAGTTAPLFTAELPIGGSTKLDDYVGKVVVLKFWATWCGPCRASLPHFQELASATAGQDVVYLALNVFDEEEPYRAWLAENEAKYPGFVFARDPAGRGAGSIASSLYNVRGIPATYVIGRDGRVVGSVLGYRPEDKSLEALLAQTGIALH